jgi:putative heme transporter
MPPSLAVVATPRPPVKTVADTGVAQRSTRDLRGYPEGVSHDAAASYVDGTHEERSHGRYWWLRWFALAVVSIVLAIEVALAWDQLAKAARSLYTAKWWWLLASALAAVLLMHSFAEVQRTLLASAGLRVRELRSEAAYYAANALSTTLPGGPVLAATFLLRQQRVWGASTLVASWQLVMSGVLQAVGLALLGLGGAFFLGARNNPFSLVFTLGGFVALLLLAQAVASRPELIDGIGGRVLSMFNSVRGRPADTGLAKWREMLGQLESVSLSRRDMATAFSWSLVNRFADVACLGFAAYAAGAHASLGGLTVACAAARAAGTIPLMPGGLLVVEAVLVPGLVSSGMTLPGAVSTMLIYRLISWLLLAAVGWVVFFFMFRTENELDPDAPDAPDALNAAAVSAAEQAAQPANATIAEPDDAAALQGPLPPPDDSSATPESTT